MNSRIFSRRAVVVAFSLLAIGAAGAALKEQIATAQTDAPLAQAAPTASTPISEDAPPTVTANESAVTEDDKKLLARYNALMAQLDRAKSPTQELINQVRSDRENYYLRALNAPGKIEPRALEGARRYLNWIVPQLETATKLAPPAPFYVAPRRGDLKIDGQLIEPAWKRAVEIPIQFDKQQKVDGETAKARLLWDKNFLYAAFAVPDKNILAPVIPRDGPVWENDCIEIFLMPDRRFGVYWELEVSPTGSILDYLSYKYPNRWGSDMREEETLEGLQIGLFARATPNQTTDRDSDYFIELAIPWNQMPGFARGAKNGDTIYALLGHVNRDDATARNATSSLAHVPFVGWFHNVWAYQPLVLSATGKPESTPK